MLLKNLYVYENSSYFIILLNDIIHLSKYTFWKSFLTKHIIKIFVECRNINMLWYSWLFSPLGKKESGMHTDEHTPVISM